MSTPRKMREKVAPLPDDDEDELQVAHQMFQTMFSRDEGSPILKGSAFSESSEEEAESVPVAKPDDEEKLAPVNAQQKKSSDDDDDERLSINADYSGIDDSEDDDDEPTVPKRAVYNPVRPSGHHDSGYSAELDDLKMKVFRQPTPEPEEFLEENAEPNENSEAAIDKFFGGICSNFLTNKCNNPQLCNRSHAFVSHDALRNTLKNTTKASVHKVYDEVVLRYNRLFQRFLVVFVEYFAEHRHQHKLPLIVKDCERLPRLIECYRQVVEGLRKSGHSAGYTAVKFLVNYQTSRPCQVAYSVTLDLIGELGPDIVHFYDYLLKASGVMTISPSVFDKIMSSILCYQHPYMPLLAVNHLLSRTEDQLREMDKDKLLKFLDMSVHLIRVHDCLVDKLKSLSERLAKN